MFIRAYKMDKRCIGSSLNGLLKLVELFPISSADCERGFSAMNLNCTDVRNRLNVQSLDALIFIKVNGPHPDDFNPCDYVEIWLKSGKHAATDVAKKTVKKSHRISAMANLF